MKVKSLISFLTIFLLSIANIFSLHAQSAEDMQAQMAKAEEAAAPGEEHAILKLLDGNWNVTSSSWMKPGDAEQKSTGSSMNQWVLGDRFLKQQYKGDWAGQPFEGIGFLGYDKMKKEYASIWMDNMSTGIFQANGQYDAASKILKTSGTFSCPMTGKKDMWFRSEWNLSNSNRLVYSMFMKDPEGKEFKSMELVYEKAK